MFDGARDLLRRLRDGALAPILEPGERVLASGMVAGAFVGRDDIQTPSLADIDLLVARALALDDLPPLPRGFLAVAAIPAVALDPLPGWTPGVDRALGGVVGRGGPDSVAAACKAGLGSSVDLVVTDRRVGLSEEDPDASPVEVAVADGSTRTVAPRRWTVVLPRAVVQGVRRRRRPLELGRLELAFTDGSSITLTAGVVSTRRANRLAAALVEPPSTDPAPNGPAPGAAS